MTWTYGGDPSALPRDAVRFHVGDTEKTDQLVSDEEIAFALSTAADNVYEAAALLLEHLSTKYARLAETETLGRRTEEYGDRSEKFARKADEVRTTGGVTAAAPRAPQIRTTERDAALSDGSRTPTQFQVGLMRNRGG